LQNYRHIIYHVPIREVGVITVCHEGGIASVLEDRVVCAHFHFISPALFGASTIIREVARREPGVVISQDDLDGEGNSSSIPKASGSSGLLVEPDPSENAF
jgi:hypothetical protein